MVPDAVEGTGNVEQTPEVETPSTGPEATEQQPSGGHPAWADLQKDLDPISWSRVEPFLKNQDAEVQKRFESKAQETAWLKELNEAGYDPDRIKASVDVARQLNENPKEVYDLLAQYLRENGLLEEAAEVEAAGEQQEQEAPTGESDLEARLREQQEQFQAYVNQQESEKLLQRETQKVDMEVSALKAAHPEFTKDDLKEIISRSISQHAATGKVPALEEVATQYTEFLNRIRSTPTPGDSAPNLLPTGGAAPGPAGQQTSVGKMTSQQIQDLIAGGLSQK